MSSQYLEQEKRKRQAENPSATQSFEPQPPPYDTQYPPKTFRPWWFRHWWKFFLIPVFFQLVLWFGAQQFLLRAVPEFKKGQYKISISGLLASVPENFPKVLVPAEFDAQKVIEQNQQTMLMGNLPMGATEFSTWLRSSLKNSEWKISTQMATPQGILFNVVGKTSRCDIVANAVDGEHVQVIYTLNNSL